MMQYTHRQNLEKVGNGPISTFVGNTAKTVKDSVGAFAKKIQQVDPLYKDLAVGSLAGLAGALYAPEIIDNMTGTEGTYHSPSDRALYGLGTAAAYQLLARAARRPPTGSISTFGEQELTEMRELRQDKQKQILQQLKNMDRKVAPVFYEKQADVIGTTVDTVKDAAIWGAEKSFKMAMIAPPLLAAAAALLYVKATSPSASTLKNMQLTAVDEELARSEAELKRARALRKMEESNAANTTGIRSLHI